MLLTIDKNKDANFLYHQLYERLKEIILEGQLKANEKLPSKRILAEQLDISLNSVTNAYEQLLAEGYIYTIERKGYFVETITKFIENNNLTHNNLPSDLKETFTDKNGWLSLSHMTSDISTFPFKKWLKCEQTAIESYQSNLSDMMHPQGPYILRKTICQMIGFTRGVVCEPEQIVISAGTQLLVQQLMMLQTYGTVFAMENPGYARIHNLVRKMKFEVLPISLDEQGINMEEIKASRANFVYVTPSHQFPTGRIMPISRRIELLNWAAQGDDRYIIEDDYDSEFKYETGSIPSLQSLDRNHRVIYMGTFSKTMLPGLRISYMVLPPELLREYLSVHADSMQSGNSTMLYSLHYFIKSGEYAKHVKMMNHKYESKRKILIKELTNRFQDRIRIPDIPAGLHFLAHFQTDISYQEIEELVAKQKLEIYTLRRFMLKKDVDESNQKDLVIGFANLKEENISEAVERLYRVFH
ncbi:PLP-dependent aminotransferase family protein [Neobacillus sp. PS3-12]|jgi:GntR family transcriptional regulator / MocR family aminotransferase|uniref:MocR-like transcriptional regulator GabR n=1 Tax=Neobacillus sp. PS3-12 TaxID=3070677 RepID=UPI0027E095A7|nr:PLP-dependent aminotransferase family protein [Neobacillus sp. PS3-12]WML55598.1 PLP-dependent aminotransferase family protein [Neobacillus sp. PS3-12]